MISLIINENLKIIIGHIKFDPRISFTKLKNKL